MFIVLLRSLADKEEESRCRRQGRTVGLLQDRKIHSQAWGEKERINCFVLLYICVPIVKELNNIPSISSASFSMHIIFCIRKRK